MSIKSEANIDALRAEIELLEAERDTALTDRHDELVKLRSENERLDIAVGSAQARELELRARVVGLERLAAEAYQVVGSLADAAGLSDTDAVQQALDNLAAAEDLSFPHETLLPFVLEKQPLKEAQAEVAYLRRALPTREELAAAINHPLEQNGALPFEGLRQLMPQSFELLLEQADAVLRLWKGEFS